ncbi:ISAs1 family transposase [Streptomyces sp. NPDC056039]|uniref:ISAs1 family transposase n=1 Tax=Streptomyces sp. NPDC056039 TaxID=3345687 RepID=UPI0035D72BB1
MSTVQSPAAPPGAADTKDPRTSHLVTHPWPMLLGLVACALLCGVRSIRGVIRWASGQGAGMLSALEVPDGDPARLPVATTLTRALARVDADALDAVVSVFVQAHAADPLAGIAGDPPVFQLAADGKTVRGARDSEGLQLHLPGVYQVDPGVMLAQREMRHKPHETVHFTAALDLIADITGAIITADALHTVADHARCLHRRGAFGLFPVKENRAVLFAQLDALDWGETTNAHVTVHRTEETNSGRHEVRIVRVQPPRPGAGELPARHPRPARRAAHHRTQRQKDPRGRPTRHHHRSVPRRRRSRPRPLRPRPVGH